VQWLCSGASVSAASNPGGLGAGFSGVRPPDRRFFYELLHPTEPSVAAGYVTSVVLETICRQLQGAYSGNPPLLVALISTEISTLAQGSEELPAGAFAASGDPGDLVGAVPLLGERAELVRAGWFGFGLGLSRAVGGWRGRRVAGCGKPDVLSGDAEPSGDDAKRAGRNE
jgi:hypothetical protein